MIDLESRKNILMQSVEDILIEADEILAIKDKTLYQQGQLLAYATALGIIKTSLSGYDLSEFKLDFDIDKKYLLD